MKLFVFEYASAGGPDSAPFLKEGMAMLSSLLVDLKEMNSHHVTTMLSPDIVGKDGLFPADNLLKSRGDFFHETSIEMERADALFIIAPETDGILQRVTKKGEESGKLIVGSSSKGVGILGDKLKTWETLNRSVEMPETKPFSGKTDFSLSVIKPKFGAGSEDVFLSDGIDMPDLSGGDYIVQPFVNGDHLSAGFVAYESSVHLLGVCRQNLSINRKIDFESVTGPIDFHSPEELIKMANSIREKVPGLKGYFGIDFIDHAEGITLIEVNPRLTTSYPIYSANMKKNLAELLLESASIAAGEV